MSKQKLIPLKKLAKCEDCGGDAFYNEYPAGWIQIGASKYGNKYEKDGIAWRCSICRKKHESGELK